MGITSKYQRVGKIISVICNSFKEIDKLVYHGDFLEAQILLDELKTSTLLESQKVKYDFLLYKIFLGLNKLAKVLNEIDCFIDQLEAKDKEKDIINALLIKAQVLAAGGNYFDSIKVAEYALQRIKKSPKLNNQEHRIVKAYVLLQLCECYYPTRAYKKALTYVRKALKIFEAANDQRGIGLAFTAIGVIKYSTGKIEEGIEFIEESLEILIDLNINHFANHARFYLVRFYFYQGQMDKAFVYMKKAMLFIDKYNDAYRVLVSNLILAPMLLEVGQYQQAKEKVLLCLTLAEQQSRPDIYGLIYYRLFKITLAQNELEEANEYYKKLLLLNEKLDNDPFITDVLPLVQALLQMKNENTIQLEQSKQLLKKIIVGNYKFKLYYYEACYYLSEILLQEFLDSGDFEKLEELNKLTKEILDFGKKENLVGFHIKANNLRLLTTWIQLQYSPNEVMSEKVEELLVNVQQIAERNSLNMTARDLSKQQLKLLQQKQSLEEFIKKYYTK